MENQWKTTKKKRWLLVVLALLLLLFAMYLCAVAGYRFMRAHPQNKQEESSEMQHTSSPTYHTPFGLPEEDVASALLPKQDIFVPHDSNDYLVITEENVVNLYILTKSGEQVYNRTLEILPDTLPEEDRSRLTEGIILDTQEDLAGLLEDYTS